MAKESTFLSVIEELGYQPIEQRAIILRFQPENLSGEIASFFSSNNYFVLQLCKEQILLLPVTYNWLGTFNKIDRSGVLELAYDTIQDVTIVEDMLNYSLSIKTAGQTMTFRVQQKELSSFRSSGMIGGESNFWGTKIKNWHQENFDATISQLLTYAKHS